MTQAYQPVYRDLTDTMHFPVLTTDDIKMGDLVYWDAANKVARALNGDLNIATLLGVAAESSNVKYHGAIQRIAVNVKKDKTVRLLIVGAEAIDMFTPVYWGGDAQTITTVVGANTLKVGVLILNSEEGEVARTTVAGERVSVLLVQSYAHMAQLANI